MGFWIHIRQSLSHFKETVDRNMNSKDNSEKDLLFLALCTYIRGCWQKHKANCASGDVTERIGKHVIENQRKDNPCYEQQRTQQDCGLVFWENGDQLTVQSVGPHTCVGMCLEHCPSWDLTQPSLQRAHVSN